MFTDHSLVKPVLTAVVILSIGCGTVLADPPVMIKDINGLHQKTATNGNLTNINGILFFTSDADNHGTELWRSDGTEVGTYIVKDICPGIQSSSPDRLHAMNNLCYFYANDGVHGVELWRSDGTEAGTWMVKDIASGSASGYSAVWWVASMIAVNGRLFFAADDGTHGSELWCTDGTETGTYLVADIYSGGASCPHYMAQLSGNVYFMAFTASGSRLWRSDGTLSGTCQVADMGGDSLTQSGGKLFFENGELYCYDGATAYLVKDINPSGDSYPSYFTDVNGTLFFHADGPEGQELWKSDGTSSGTVLVKDINPTGHSYPEYLRAIGNTLYFSAEDAGGARELWKSDGTTAGTVNVSAGIDGVEEITPGSGRLFFRAYDMVHGPEIYSYDLSSGTVTLITDVYIDSQPIYMVSIYNIIPIGEKLFFRIDWSANPAYPNGVYVMDEIPGNVRKIRDLLVSYSGSSSPRAFSPLKGMALFMANDGVHSCQLWKTDGTEAGTSIVKNISPSGTSFLNSPLNPCTLHDTLLFAAYDGVSTSLWKSDGTEDGTQKVKDVAVADKTEYLIFRDKAWFFDSDGALWVTDGSEPNTILVKDTNPADSTPPFNLSAAANGIVFAANDGTHGIELWRSDGTADGTVMVKDVYIGSGSSIPSTRFVAAGNRTFFPAYTPACGYELWATDGTQGGTYQVRDIYLGTSTSGPLLLDALGESVLFSARDSATASGQLWKSDGTEGGTVLVKNSVYARTTLPHLVWNGVQYFIAGSSTTISQLWRSDGTEAGTWMLADLGAGRSVEAMDVVSNRLVLATFRSGDGAGWLWISDGTVAGTYKTTGILTGMTVQSAYSTGQPLFTRIDNTLLLSAYSSSNPCGFEPWLLRLDHGDANLDGTINFMDFAALAGNWLSENCNMTNGWCGGADITDFGRIDVKDLALFAANWLGS
jgi:ELWxxDGT repeat protein